MAKTASYAGTFQSSSPINKYLHRIISLIIIWNLCSSCNTGPGKLDDILVGTLRSQVNPYERVPLGGQLAFRTEEDCKVSIEVTGKNPIRREFPDYSTRHSIPVLGLYADTTNTVSIKLTTRSGKIYQGQVKMKTVPLPDFFPTIEIDKLNKDQMEPGMHLIEMLIANNGKFLTYTIMFDDNGDIRWFMDLSSMGQITYTALRIQSGNWLYLNWIDLYEFTDLGEQVKKEQMWNYAGNHSILELANGNLLMGGSKKDAKVIRDGKEIVTRFDHVVEWSRKENRGVKDWDMGQVLDIDRSVYPEDYSLDFKSDWFHINGLDISKKDNSLIISGRNQGVVKVDAENNLKWILALKTGWGKAGRNRDGLNTSQYLLTAVDSTGKPYPQEVQEGKEGRDDFEWSTGQHAAQVLENGNILLFDNGLYRNLNPKPTYSRAVEYHIDEDKKTVQQVWQYGKSRGLDMFSPITSDVDVLPNTGNRLITAGNIRLSDKPPHAKLIEITYPDNKVVFEASVYFKDALGTGAKSWAQFDLVFRGERYPLYAK